MDPHALQLVPLYPSGSSWTAAQQIQQPLPALAAAATTTTTTTTRSAAAASPPVRGSTATSELPEGVPLLQLYVSFLGCCCFAWLIYLLLPRGCKQAYWKQMQQRPERPVQGRSNDGNNHNHNATAQRQRQVPTTPGSAWQSSPTHNSTNNPYRSKKMAPLAVAQTEADLENHHTPSTKAPNIFGTADPSPAHPQIKPLPAEDVWRECYRRLQGKGMRLTAHGVQCPSKRIWLQYQDTDNEQTLLWQTEFPRQIPPSQRTVWVRGAVHRIPAGNVLYIDVGKKTTALMQATTVAPSTCFSLLTQAGSLDLQANSQLERDAIVSALSYILDQVHHDGAWRHLYDESSTIVSGGSPGSRVISTTASSAGGALSNIDSDMFPPPRPPTSTNATKRGLSAAGQKLGLRSTTITATTLTLLCVTASWATTTALDTSVVDDLYPPYEEYDAIILDPLHAYGSPYGGFSRNTRRQLAALPLMLPELVVEGEDSSTKQGEKTREPLYTTVRDGSTGQLLACRVYHEDELEPSSLTDSLFAPPVLRASGGEASEDPSTGSGGGGSSSSSPTTVVSASASHDNTKSTSTQQSNNEKQNTKNEVPAMTTSSSTTTTTTFSQEDRVAMLSQRLEVLEQICAQIHQGWWSYEWCYQQSLAQFHVAMKDGKVDVEDVTSLGRFVYRKWFLDLHNNIEDVNPLAENTKELARVLDIHEGGTLCPDTNEPRRAVVNILCCSENIMSKKKALLRKGSKPIESDDDLVVHSVKEDPEKICTYNVTICTSLLCAKPEDDDGSVVIKDDDEEEEKRRRTPLENESIMQILDRVLGGRKPVCLQSLTGGWWTFEFCHGQSIRQYHEVIGTRRDKHGVSQTIRAIETDHNLGLPQTNIFQAIVPEDEWKFVVNSTDKNGLKKSYFELEYTNGDICDDDDVRDSAIVAGNSGAQGLARSSSVRYFCGETYDIKVNEDSTCHYVVNVVLPDLCRHPIFKTPVSKKQLFKCLPVDEPEVDASVVFS